MAGIVEPRVFFCPSGSGNSGSTVSYGYSGAMVRADGKGLTAFDVREPTKLGLVCDASPVRNLPDGGLVGSVAAPFASKKMEPENRHLRGIVAGYCDGHVAYHEEGFAESDANNAVYKGFIKPVESGFLGPATRP